MDHTNEYYDDYTAYGDEYDPYNPDVLSPNPYYDDHVYDQAEYHALSPKKEEVFTVLRLEDVFEKIQEMVDDMTDCTGVHNDIALAVLAYNNFNKDKSTHGILDTPGSVFASAGVDRWGKGVEFTTTPALVASYQEYLSTIHTPTTHNSNAVGDSSSTTVMCSICWDDVSESAIITAPCTHSCCVSCWSTHAATHLVTSSCLTCVAEGCKQTVPWSLIKVLGNSGHSCSSSSSSSSSSSGNSEEDRKDDTSISTDKKDYISSPTSPTSPTSLSATTSTTPTSPTTTTSSTPTVQSCGACACTLYVTALAKAYTHTSPSLKWCITPNCPHVIFTTHIHDNVTCVCGQLFCFDCESENHRPANCAEMRRWNELGRKENTNVQWIMNNTHKCPKCGVRIEKNSGCNHMTCTSCKYEFCWVCNGEWAAHLQQAQDRVSAYICNKYDPEILYGKENRASNDDSDLQRYLFYYSRALNHQVSAKFAKTNKTILEKRFNSMALKKARSVGKHEDFDVVVFGDAIIEATDVLIECKRILQYSYIHGFCLEDKTAHKNLFEYQQSELEMASESLAEVLHTFTASSGGLTVMNAMRACQESMTSFVKTYE